jgi:hypothetical protein
LWLFIRINFKNIQEPYIKWLVETRLTVYQKRYEQNIAQVTLDSSKLQLLFCMFFQEIKYKYQGSGRYKKYRICEFLTNWGERYKVQVANEQYIFITCN